MISELEIRLGVLISAISEEELIKMIRGQDTEDSRKIEKNYEDAKQNGTESAFIEYLYLSDMIKIVAAKKLFSPLGYMSTKRFKNDLGSINELRHQIAHPARSLITKPQDVQDLWRKIARIEAALFNLRLAQDRVIPNVPELQTSKEERTGGFTSHHGLLEKRTFLAWKAG